MVKKIFIALLLISFLVFAMALDEPSAAIGEEDVKKLEEAIDYIPIDDSGELDPDSYKPIQTRAEEKIDEINAWLEKNATWLKAVFGMVPSVTWLFTINLYLLIVFFTVLVLKGEAIFGIIDGLTKKVELGIIETTWANLLGLVVFLILNFTKVIASIAKMITDQIGFIWNKVLPIGIVAAIITMVIVVIILFIIYKYFPLVFEMLKKKREEMKERRAKQKEDLNRQVLEKVAHGAIQGA